MQEHDKGIPLYPALYVLILSLALFLRLYRLGAAPLSDFEARTALQAGALLRGESPVLEGQPLTLMSQAAAFFLLGENNFTARLLSALLGAVLAALPWFWRRTLGDSAALLLAAGLACAPGLVAVSRLAGGPAAALTLGLALLTALRFGAGFWQGALAGLFLLGGPWAWSGLLGFGLAWGIARMAGLPAGGETRFRMGAPAAGETRRAFLQGAVFSLALGGTLFLRFPQGFGAFGQSLSAAGRAFFIPSGVPFARLLAALTWQHLLAALLALAGAALAWKRGLPWGRFALLWLLTALLTTLLLAGRQVMDAAWALIPLYALAALGLEAAFSLSAWRRAGMWLFAALTLVLASSAWLTLAGMPAGEFSEASVWQRWLLFGALLSVWLISGLLTALGWERAFTLQGGALGLTLALGLVMLSQVWSGAVAARTPASLWFPAPLPARLDLLTDTLGDAAEFFSGRRDALTVRLDVDSPALRWALRRFDVLPPDTADPAASSLPAAVIAPEGAPAPNAQALYRGQDFVWQARPAWETALPPAAVRWFVLREAPQQAERVVLWLRGDLFPGGSAIPAAAGSAAPPSEDPLIP